MERGRGCADVDGVGDGAVGVAVHVAGDMGGGEDGGGEGEGKDGDEGNERGHGWWRTYKGLTDYILGREEDGSRKISTIRRLK
jgi:hypothetical protein